jgi:hypothetical protein
MGPFDKIREEGKEIRKEVHARTVGYIIAGLSVVVGLAWNDAIKGLIDQVFPLQENSLWARFIYAVLITLLLVLLSMYVLKNPKEGEK